MIDNFIYFIYCQADCLHILVMAIDTRKRLSTSPHEDGQPEEIFNTKLLPAEI